MTELKFSSKKLVNNFFLGGELKALELSKNISALAMTCQKEKGNCKNCIQSKDIKL